MNEQIMCNYEQVGHMLCTGNDKMFSEGNWSQECEYELNIPCRFYFYFYFFLRRQCKSYLVMKQII